MFGADARGGNGMAPAHTRAARGRRRLSRVGLFTVVAAMVLLASACDWPMFRQNIGHTAFSGDVGPANVASLSVRFIMPTRTSVFGSAAVANGVLYVGSLDGHFYAFDANGSTNCAGAPLTCAPL